MCIGDMELDTIGEGERATLRLAATRSFPRHAFGVHANEEGLVWVVLEPPAAREGADRADLLRFTICRIAPCVMVMTEDSAGRRQIGSAGDLEGAMAFACMAAGLVSGNTHPPHAVMQ